MSVLQSEIDFVVATPVATAPLVVHLCRTWPELEQFFPEWNTLLESCSNASIFQTPEWLSAWWHAYGEQKSLHALIFTNAQGKTVGIAPLYVEQTNFLGLPLRRLRLVGAGSGDSDALDFIPAPGYEQHCAETFLTWLANESKCDLCALETLPETSLLGRHVSARMNEEGRHLYAEIEPNFFIDLPPTWR